MPSWRSSRDASSRRAGTFGARVVPKKEYRSVVPCSSLVSGWCSWRRRPVLPLRRSRTRTTGRSRSSSRRRSSACEARRRDRRQRRPAHDGAEGLQGARQDPGAELRRRVRDAAGAARRGRQPDPPAAARRAHDDRADAAALRRCSGAGSPRSRRASTRSSPSTTTARRSTTAPPPRSCSRRAAKDAEVRAVLGVSLGSDQDALLGTSRQAKAAPS